MNYYIDIEGNLKPVNFMDSLFDKIVDKFKDDKYYKCYIKADKKLKLKITFEQKENEDEEEKYENELEDELKMEIILYKTPKGYLLRFIKEKMNKRDFIEKYVTISKLVKELSLGILLLYNEFWLELKFSVTKFEVGLIFTFSVK